MIVMNSMYIRATICWIAFWAATSSQAGADPPPKVSWEAAGMDPVMESRFDHVVVRWMDDGNMAGCVVLVGRREGIVFERAYGYRSVEPSKEEMTTDTVFDMASLTKPVATATSVMILLERGQLRLQDKVAKFFPEFAANGKENVTVEQLLVHSSGLIPDNPLADYENGWESAKPKVCDLKLLTEPGKNFKYSDVNFILLGKIVEAVTGKPVNEFAKDEIYNKLGMKDSGYLPNDEQKARSASTEKTGDKWLKGEVHDPRASKMGGVAGHAGLFSTAEDLAIYADTMLNQGRRGEVQLISAATFAEMIRPRNIDGQKRGLGWDHGTSYSRNRGELMSDSAFGHGGFTGTAMWIDPKLDLYVIFLSNRLHPDGIGEVNDLAGRIGTIACAAILDASGKVTPGHDERANQVTFAERRRSWRRRTTRVAEKQADEPSPGPSLQGRGKDVAPVKLGIDVLAADDFKLMQGKRVGLITNHTGRDSNGTTTIDLLHKAPNVKLVALFSPEHGIRGALDISNISDSVDEKTGLPVYSLYGESRKPNAKQLENIDVLVFDIQDIGARFYTYTSTMGLCMEAAAEAGKMYVVLDRPNPIGGVLVEGPLLDEGGESFVAHHRLPVRHGMTIGELANMFAKERELKVDLHVIELKDWKRDQYQFDTNQTWVNPSPNMRSLRAAVLYPGVGMLEFTNISVGRGTETPFELIGAPWIRERELAAKVNAANPPGIRVLPMRFTPNASKFPNEECGGLSFVITDWEKFRSFEFGLILAQALHELHPKEWEPERWMRLLGNKEVYERALKGDAPSEILQSIDEDLKDYRARKKQFQLYD